VHALRTQGRYAKARLVERFGADMAAPDVFTELAACERRRSFGNSCGAIHRSGEETELGHRVTMSGERGDDLRIVDRLVRWPSADHDLR
jgi:hypothetical protein